MEYMIGDRIEIIKTPIFSNIKIGDTGRITSTLNQFWNCYDIEFDNGIKECCHDSRFKKIEIDYTKTYVKVSNENELKIALKFYKEKTGYGSNHLSIRLLDKGYTYVKKNNYNYYYSNYDNTHLSGFVDITEEVLGKQCDGIKPDVVVIDMAIGESQTAIETSAYKKIYEMDKKSSFKSLYKKTMNTLRKIMFQEVDLKKLAKLVESTEQKLEPIAELYNYLENFISGVRSNISGLEISVEDENKSGINEYKKNIEMDNIIIDDELVKQLLMISKKLLKK